MEVLIVVVAMLNEDASIDTVQSYMVDIIPRRRQHEVDNDGSSVDNEPDEGTIWSDIILSPTSSEVWRESSPPPPPKATSGILIVPGNDDPETSDHLFRTAMNLSLPGTDSIPSDLDSLSDPLERAQILVSDDECGAEHPEAAGVTMPEIEDKIQVADEKISVSRNVRQNIVLVAISLSLFASTCCLFYERSAWKLSIKSLNEEIGQLKAQVKKEQKQDSKSTGFEFPWENCRDDKSSDKFTTLIDNCWLNAKATIGLGQCANKAKQTVMDLLGDLGTSIWKAHETSRVKIEDLTNKFQEESETVVTHVEEWAKSLWKNSYSPMEEFLQEETRSEKREGNGTTKTGLSPLTESSVEKIESNADQTAEANYMSGSFDNVASIISGLAFASIAGIITDEIASYLTEVARDAVIDASVANQIDMN